MKLTLWLGDCLVRMEGVEDGALQWSVFDPPYDLTSGSRGGSPRVAGTGPFGRHTNDTKVTPRGFMGKTWDGTGIAFSPELWGQVHRVLASGGVVKAFCGTRTYHRMAAAMGEAGFVDFRFEAWCFGSGFPKSLNVGKALDRQLGVARETKRIEFTGNALMRHGGDNTRPWMEEALEKGYHELQGDEPASDEAKLWDGWGTALKPAWEPIVVATRP